MVSRLRSFGLLTLAITLVGCDQGMIGISSALRPDWTVPATSLPPETVAWAKWLAEHTDVREAQKWKRTRAEVLMPTIWSGRESGVSEEVLLASDGKAAYTFDGVKVQVRSRTSKPEGGRVALQLPSATGPGAAALYLAAGRTREAEACAREESDPVGAGRVLRAVVAHAWHRHDRVLAALMRGDDATGARLAEDLQTDAPSLRSMLAGFGDKGGLAIPPESLLDFLDGLPKERDDLRRRADRPRLIGKRVEIARSSDVATLIEALEDHASRQWSQPGGVNSTDDPVVQALVAKGDASVPLLLDAVERDRRLTRAVGFGRDFFPGRRVLTVAGVARVALGQIAGVERFPGETRPDGTSDVGAIRAFFAKTLGKSLAQRALAVLEDDLAGDEMGWQQYEAALTRLTDAPATIRNGGFSQGERTDLFGPKTSWRADELSATEHRELVALLDQRAREIRVKAAAPRSSMDTSILAVGLRLAVVRGLIEPQGALPALRDGTATALTLGRQTFYAPYADNFAADLAATFLLRARLGDVDALEEYRNWLRSSDFDRGFGPDLAPLAPLRDADRDPRYTPVVRWVTEDPASPWNQRLQKLAEWDRGFNRYGGPMPAFVRDVLLRALEDRTVKAVAHHTGRMVEVTPTTGSGYSMGVNPREKGRKAGSQWPLRQCDFVAQEVLFLVNGWSGGRYQAPIAFSLLASERDRDRAIAQIRARLATRH